MKWAWKRKHILFWSTRTLALLARLKAFVSGMSSSTQLKVSDRNPLKCSTAPLLMALTWQGPASSASMMSRCLKSCWCWRIENCCDEMNSSCWLPFCHSTLFIWNVLLSTVFISVLVLKEMFVTHSTISPSSSQVKETSLRFLLKSWENNSSNFSHECVKLKAYRSTTFFNVSKDFIHPDNLSPFLKLSQDLGRRFT